MVYIAILVFGILPLSLLALLGVPIIRWFQNDGIPAGYEERLAAGYYDGPSYRCSNPHHYDCWELKGSSGRCRKCGSPLRRVFITLQEYKDEPRRILRNPTDIPIG